MPLHAKLRIILCTHLHCWLPARSEARRIFSSIYAQKLPGAGNNSAESRRAHGNLLLHAQRLLYKQLQPSVASRPSAAAAAAAAVARKVMKAVATEAGTKYIPPPPASERA